MYAIIIVYGHSQGFEWNFYVNHVFHLKKKVFSLIFMWYV